MAREIMTDEMVEQEIQRLQESELVKLAKKEEQIRYRRRQYLYQLRCLEKKGRALKAAGITMDILSGIGSENDAFEEE